jgi:hypothetical protein
MCSLLPQITLPPRSANEGQTVRRATRNMSVAGFRDEMSRAEDRAYISGLVVLEIANRKLAEEAVVVFLSELVVPRAGLRIGGVLVFPA